MAWLRPHTETRTKKWYASPRPCMQDHECRVPVPETWVAGLRWRTCGESLGLESQTGFQVWEARLCKILQVSLNINGTECFL